MKILLHKLFSLFLCFVILLSNYITTGKFVVNQGNDAEELIQEEVPAVKPYQVIFSRGCWLAEEPFYEGVSDESQEVLSTQKFTADTLPIGSVISIAEGVTCQMLQWGVEPETVTPEILVGPEWKVSEEFWEDSCCCAFNLKINAEIDPRSLPELFSVSVPIESRDRREFSWNDDNCLSILAIGNSFSVDALEYVWNIAKSAGVNNVRIGNLVYGGCRIEQHYLFWTEEKYEYIYQQNTNGVWESESNVSYLKAFENNDWDFISFQQSAQTVQSEEEEYALLWELISMAKEWCPNARIVYHMPWPNPHPNYDNNTETMFRDCMMTARRIIETDPQIEEIICTGTAIQNARTSFISNDSLLRDGWHLSYDIGRYIAGLAFFSQLTGMRVNDITYAPDNISDTFRKVAIESAANALENPRLVTPSAYGPIPEANEN